MTGSAPQAPQQRGAQQPPRPRNRRRQAWVFAVLNVPMRAVLGLPIGTPLGRNLMLAYIVGRRTGKLYRQPVSYVRDGDVLLTPGGGRWKLNLAGGAPLRVRVRGRDLQVTPELVDDPAEVRRLLSVIAAGNPPAARFTGIRRDADGQFDLTGVTAAVTDGFAIVRWHLPSDAAI